LILRTASIKARCSFDDQTFQPIKGFIHLQSLDTGDIFVSFKIQDPQSKFAPTGNQIHIHQYGINNEETSCGAPVTGLHYNPVLNYGELSGYYGYFTPETLMTFTFTITHDVEFFGEYGILGRSLVLHHSDGTRLGCCNIAIHNLDDGEGIPKKIAPSAIAAGKCGPAIFYQNTSDHDAIINSDDAELNMWVLSDYICTDQVPGAVSIHLNPDQELTVGWSMNGIDDKQMFPFGGLKFLYSHNNYTVDGCCCWIHKYAQPNENDVFVQTISDETMSTYETSDTAMGYFLAIAPIAIYVFASLF